MIKELLEASEGRLLLPLVAVVAGAYLAKGLFGLHRSRSQDRRDFLDLFHNWQEQPDLWLTVAVRHVFGAYLPADLIRQLMAGPQPGRALLEVGSAWDMLDMDDETREVYWRWGFHKKTRLRILAKRIALGLYFLLAALAVLCGFGAYAGALGISTPWILWIWACAFAALAMRCLSYSIDISQADEAARRWLGI